MSEKKFRPDKYKDGSLIEHWTGPDKAPESTAERMARALYASEPSLLSLDQARHLVPSIIAALDGNGLVIVPREPTEAMVEAADRTEHSIEAVTEELAPPRDVQLRNFWRAMTEEALKG